MSLHLAALLLLGMARWFPEVADAGPVFNVADFGAVAGGHTDNSKVVFSDNFCSPADDIFHLAVQS
jgi:hypothetical protein